MEKFRELFEGIKKSDSFGKYKDEWVYSKSGEELFFNSTDIDEIFTVSKSGNEYECQVVDPSDDEFSITFKTADEFNKKMKSKGIKITDKILKEL